MRGHKQVLLGFQGWKSRGFGLEPAGKLPRVPASTYEIGSAELYADLGDKNDAFEWLSTAYQEHDMSLISLRTDFTMGSPRSDPRYAERVRKIGLPQ
jgi:hypothetical protein